MISLCTCLTQLDQSFVQSFGVFLLDHILLIVLKYLSDESTVSFFSSILTPFKAHFTSRTPPKSVSDQILFAFRDSSNWKSRFSNSFLFLFRTQVRKSANSTLLYLIENGFLDKKVSAIKILTHFSIENLIPRQRQLINAKLSLFVGY